MFTFTVFTGRWSTFLFNRKRVFPFCRVGNVRFYPLSHMHCNDVLLLGRDPHRCKDIYVSFLNYREPCPSLSGFNEWQEVPSKGRTFIWSGKPATGSLTRKSSQSDSVQLPPMALWELCQGTFPSVHMWITFALYAYHGFKFSQNRIMALPFLRSKTTATWQREVLGCHSTQGVNKLKTRTTKSLGKLWMLSHLS